MGDLTNSILTASGIAIFVLVFWGFLFLIGKIFIQSYEKKPLQYVSSDKINKININRNTKNMNKKSFWGYIKNLYNGRISRKNYFLGLLLTIITFGLSISIILALFSDSYSGESTPFGIIIFILVYIAYLVFILSLHVRRFHDKGESGWRIFLFLVPLLNLIILLTLFFEEGQEETNKYGENPLKTNRGFWDTIFNKVSEAQVVAENNPLPTENYKYCHKCGNRLEADSKFCTKCGSKLQN